MDRIDSMRVFVRVAEANSFTRAADSLGLPRASVSAAVMQLEALLGVRLLQRTTRRVHLTLDGESLLDRCRILLKEMDDIEGLFRIQPEQIKGRVRINVPSRMGHRIIVPALPVFFQQYPGIELEIASTDHVVDLIEEGVDCVLRAGRLENSSLVARSMGMLKQINCASPEYLVHYGTPMTPDDLVNHLTVGFALLNHTRMATWEYLQDGESRVVAMTSKVTVDSAENYIACARAGLGLIQVPAYDVREHIALGELVEVLSQAQAAPLPLTLLYSHRSHISQRLMVFIEWLGDLLRKEGVVSVDR